MRNKQLSSWVPGGTQVKKRIRARKKLEQKMTINMSISRVLLICWFKGMFFLNNGFRSYRGSW